LWEFPRLHTEARNSLQELKTPILLIFGFTVLVLSLGFLYGGVGDPLGTARIRFSHGLPGDNELPLMFANQLRRGHVMKPMFMDWLSSDRPPLQTGVLLSQFPLWAHPAAVEYMLLSVILQSLSILSIWLFLRVFRLDQRAIALSIAVTVLSGFFLLNSFFVWPKLLAAAYMLPVSAFLLSDHYRELLAHRKALAVMTGASLALSMLSHGGTAFAVLGLILTLIVLRVRVKPTAVLIVVLSCTALYLPWVLYQKCYDPPGDRLLKWHLAGIQDLDPRPFAQALQEVYRSTTWRDLLANKEANFGAVFAHEQQYWTTVRQFLKALPRNGKNAEAMRIQIRDLQFYFFVPTLGYLMIGPAFLARGFARRGRTLEWHASIRIWCYIFCTLLVWICLMFRPGSAIIHQGTYTVTLLAFVGSVLAMWAASQWLATGVSIVQVCFTMLVYGAYWSGHGAPNIRMLILAVLALTFESVLLIRVGGNKLAAPADGARHRSVLTMLL
jgi:hypothetical protein